MLYPTYSEWLNVFTDEQAVMQWKCGDLCTDNAFWEFTHALLQTAEFNHLLHSQNCVIYVKPFQCWKSDLVADIPKLFMRRCLVSVSIYLLNIKILCLQFSIWAVFSIDCLLPLFLFPVFVLPACKALWYRNAASICGWLGSKQALRTDPHLLLVLRSSIDISDADLKHR